MSTPRNTVWPEEDDAYDFEVDYPWANLFGDMLDTNLTDDDVDWAYPYDPEW